MYQGSEQEQLFVWVGVLGWCLGLVLVELLHRVENSGLCCIIARGRNLAASAHGCSISLALAMLCYAVL
jgi:hypothetical protein